MKKSKEELKECFLELLKYDEDIIGSIKMIIENSKKEDYKNIYENNGKLENNIRLKLEKEYQEKCEKCNYKLKENDLNKVKKEIDELKLNNENLKNQLIDLNEIKKENEDFRNKVTELEKIKKVYDKYARLENVYKKYLGLGEVVIRDLERILNSAQAASSSPEIFMAYGIQEGNIIALWEVIATNIEQYSTLDKLEDLQKIFEYFLSLYKEVSYKKVESWYPTEGDFFDERFQTRTSNSNAVGKIEKVLLPGFSIGKNISKKALVKVV